jgi:arsenate reductase (thioredoxin)
MAEAWTRHLKADQYEPYSAGVEVRPVDPLAIRVMAEVGIDISGQLSKHVDSLQDLEFAYVVTVCDHAREACPFFPARTRLLHREFADPPRLAQSARNEEEAMDYYRKVRDEIKAFVEGLQETLEKDE